MEKEKVILSHTEGRLLARIIGDVDHHSARGIREKIDGEAFLYRPRVLVIDLSSVGFMDSSGIALILGRVEVMSALSGAVQIIGATPPIKKLIHLSGIERVTGLTVAP